jgi:hypothetical protein
MSNVKLRSAEGTYCLTWRYRGTSRFAMTTRCVTLYAKLPVSRSMLSSVCPMSAWLVLSGGSCGTSLGTWGGSIGFPLASVMGGYGMHLMVHRATRRRIQSVEPGRWSDLVSLSSSSVCVGEAWWGCTDSAGYGWFDRRV